MVRRSFFSSEHHSEGGGISWDTFCLYMFRGTQHGAVFLRFPLNTTRQMVPRGRDKNTGIKATHKANTALRATSYTLLFHQKMPFRPVSGKRPHLSKFGAELFGRVLSRLVWWFSHNKWSTPSVTELRLRRTSGSWRMCSISPSVAQAATPVLCRSWEKKYECHSWVLNSRKCVVAPDNRQTW